jgi:hypothetical protein
MFVCPLDVVAVAVSSGKEPIGVSAARDGGSYTRTAVIDRRYISAQATGLCLLHGCLLTSFRKRGLLEW